MNSRTLFILGMATCIVAAVLMVGGGVDIGWGSALGVVGIGLLSAAASRRTTANRPRPR